VDEFVDRDGIGAGIRYGTVPRTKGGAADEEGLEERLKALGYK
jgi:hypothetical protein